MLNILLAVHLILAVSIIILVLMQRSEGGGLGIGGGGNNGKSASLGKLDGLQRATWAIGAAFFITSIILAILATRGAGGSSSLLDQLEGVNASDVIQSETNADEDTSSAPSDPNAGTDVPSDPNAESGDGTKTSAETPATDAPTDPNAQ